MDVDLEKIASQFKFCPVCAGDLEHKGEYSECAQCGYHKYVNPVPCNAAILENSQGEILLVKRKTEPLKGMWDLPGGFVGPNETIEQSMERELDEEIKIKAADLKYYTSSNDSYTYTGVTFPTIASIFTGKIDDQKPIASDDAEEVMFFKKNELPFEDIAFVSLRKVLEEYCN